MRKLVTLLLACGAFAAIASPGALANPNPSETGPPSQSCQEQEPNSPGNAEESRGAPFNEPKENSLEGGIGGQHYSEKSQYDVACYQQSQH